MKKKWGDCPPKGTVSKFTGGDETRELVCKSLLRLNFFNRTFHVHYSLSSPAMYKIQFELTATLVPSNQPPSTPHAFANPFNSLPSYTTVWLEDYYGGFPFYAGPVYQGMAPNQQVQYTGPVYPMAPNQQPQNQYRPPTSGPSRKQRRKEACIHTKTSFT